MFRREQAPRIEFPRGHNALGLAYFRAVSPEPIPQITPLRASESLTEFSEIMAGERLAELMGQFRKVDAAIEPPEFVIKPVFGRGPKDLGHGKGRGNFYMDSNRGIALGIRDEDLGDNIWIAVAGITLGRELDSYIPLWEKDEEVFRRNGFGRMGFPYEFPTITLLQGPHRATYAERWSKNTDRYSKAAQILRQYKWERAMIELTLEWAGLQGSPAVYLLPAALNRYNRRSSTPEEKERLRFRYDVSAERMGFRMQPNGLYGISLLPFPNS